MSQQFQKDSDVQQTSDMPRSDLSSNQPSDIKKSKVGQKDLHGSQQKYGGQSDVQQNLDKDWNKDSSNLSSGINQDQNKQMPSSSSAEGTTSGIGGSSSGVGSSGFSGTTHTTNTEDYGLNKGDIGENLPKGTSGKSQQQDQDRFTGSSEQKNY